MWLFTLISFYYKLSIKVSFKFLWWKNKTKKKFAFNLTILHYPYLEKNSPSALRKMNKQWFMKTEDKLHVVKNILFDNKNVHTCYFFTWDLSRVEINMGCYLSGHSFLKWECLLFYSSIVHTTDNNAIKKVSYLKLAIVSRKCIRRIMR